MEGRAALCAFIGAQRRPFTAAAAEGTRVSAPECPLCLRSFAFNMFTLPWSRVCASLPALNGIFQYLRILNTLPHAIA